MLSLRALTCTPHDSLRHAPPAPGASARFCVAFFSPLTTHSPHPFYPHSIEYNISYVYHAMSCYFAR